MMTKYADREYKKYALNRRFYGNWRDSGADGGAGSHWRR